MAADQPTAAALAAGRLTLAAAHAARGDDATARGYLALVRWARAPLLRTDRGRWPVYADRVINRGYTYWFNDDVVWVDYVTRRRVSRDPRSGQAAYVLSRTWIAGGSGGAADVYADTAEAADAEAVRRFAAMSTEAQWAHLTGVCYETKMPKYFDLGGGYALEVGLVDDTTPAAAWVCLGVTYPSGRWQSEPEPVIVWFTEAGATARLVAVARGCLAAGDCHPLLDAVQEHAHLWPPATAARLEDYTTGVSAASAVGRSL